ncbi:MAG TPA: site-2 protease family protein [Spirochaetes bacterium]|nr:site-2 protease family protein [Spirochaetota bacterium]
MFGIDFSQIILFIGTFMVAGSIHEFSHAATAYFLGDSTAKHEGRMTINPLAHIDLVGTILLPMFIGFGWMKPVPVFLGNLRHPMRDYAIIAFAGPFSNLVQACFALLIANLFAIQSPLLIKIFSHYILINILLMGFNLLPIAPLDGGAILHYFLPRSMKEGFERFSQYSGFILLAIILLPYLGFPNLLGYWLYPFDMARKSLLHWDTMNIFLLNLGLFGIIGFFLRDEIKRLMNKADWEAKRVSDKGKAVKTTLDNKKYIKLAQDIIPKVDEGIPLTTSEITELKAIQSTLDPKANICSPPDYDIEDPTCQNCEWFRNCLVRKAGESSQ